MAENELVMLYIYTRRPPDGWSLEWIGTGGETPGIISGLGCTGEDSNIDVHTRIIRGGGAGGPCSPTLVENDYCKVLATVLQFSITES